MAKRHWIAVLLVVSLGLNLLGAGALLARLTMRSDLPGPWPGRCVIWIPLPVNAWVRGTARSHAASGARASGV